MTSSVSKSVRFKANGEWVYALVLGDGKAATVGRDNVARFWSSLDEVVAGFGGDASTVEDAEVAP